ncbi:MAG: phospho-sugar mutase [Streptomycetaceae bacterium]|nr:MAG: phospho-sugar mutase [Streptomycetaceae bacterium]
MIAQELRTLVTAWIEDDPDIKTAELLQHYLDTENEAELKSSFSGFLEFGTAGLRGALGPGPSRMNRAVVGRTAAGLAEFMKSRNLDSIVIGRDARYGSEDFTNDTAEIMAGAGFKVFVLPRPLPTPVIAYAVTALKVGVGVMVTASHNPAQDNGYKVYLGGVVDEINYNGSQIISPTDVTISSEIAKINSLKEVSRSTNWKVLDEAIVSRYVTDTAKIVTPGSNLKVVYTAMHGVGTKTLLSVFAAADFATPILVSAQADPDPDFPTVSFPNPEESGALNLALETAKNCDADIVIANDPDADRCAVAIKSDGGWRMLRGDEVGAILGESIASAGATGTFANSIVSSAILRKIANHYGLNFAETLTGFKWLAKIPNLTFGYEEALGYCVDSAAVNDKDGISAALKIVEIASNLANSKSSLSRYLDEIWLKYGYHATAQVSLRVSDLSKIALIMERFRNHTPTEIAGEKVNNFSDLARPENGFPATDCIRFWLGESARIIIRPSGTEPKVKCYIEVVKMGEVAAAKSAADSQIETLRQALTKLLVG